MKVILLTFFTLAFVRGGGALPCEETSTIDAFNVFIKKHIVQTDFPRQSHEEWEKYLKSEGLCGTAVVQSFIEDADKGNVLKICSKAGRRPQTPVPSRPSLCISESTMLVYHVTSDIITCKVKKIVGSRDNVIVACNRIGDHPVPECLPVHYQSGNLKPGNIPCV
ncbi:uncharacterized protein LOC124054203 [Scomber scombrus]|uniref:Uncharacterized protein LOC124054203 n=1 Tax=Scomber scombrus TaxID=13677 RepID=A0AAV1PZ07_SCOSC